MGNFQDSRFFGLSPRAIGLSVVAVGVVVGLFFIPETVKLLFDAKPRASKEKVVASKQPGTAQKRADRGDGKASLAPDALTALNANMQRPKMDKNAAEEKPAPGVKVSKKALDVDEGKGQGGIFSGWNFQVKADAGSRPVEAPITLTLDRLQSKEGMAFLKKSLSSIDRFVRSEGVGGNAVADATQHLRNEVESILAGAAKGASGEEVASRLKQAHISSLRALRSSGADRGAMLRWLQVPLVSFIDQKGNVGAQRAMQASFSPGLVLSDLFVQNRGSANSVGGVVNYQAEFSILGSDVERVVVYSNGSVLRSYSMRRTRANEVRSIRLKGQGQGAITVVAYDAFGGRPFSKIYSFYPRVTVFRQDDRGAFQIGFLPGSARNSLDRFFLIGGSGRPIRRDPMISAF